MSSTATLQDSTVDYYLNSEGDLYLKYFLIDSSFNTRGFSVDPSILERIAKQAVGKPFTDYEDVSFSLFRDGHPWSPKQGATYKDHLEYARDLASGVIVDFSPVSRNALKSASGIDIQKNNGFYVTVKVTDPNKKQKYLQDPNRIPRVSPGIFDYDFTNMPANNLKNIDFVHLAGVKYGAYGEKARLYAKCQGGYECVNHLKGASNDDFYNSSLGESSQNDSVNRMVDNPQSNTTIDNNNSTATASLQQPQSQPEPQQNNQEVNSNNKQVETQNQNQNNNNNTSQPNTNTNNNIPGSPIERLKARYYGSNYSDQSQANTKQVPNWKEDPDYIKLLREHEELKQKVELEDQKKFYAELIPKEIFIINGKFNTEGYNKEIEKAIEKRLDPEFARDYYTKRLENIRLANKLAGKPFGASSSFAVDFSNVDNNNNNNNNNKRQAVATQGQYQTPDSVPEVKGASDVHSSQFQSLINIRRMFGLFSNNGGSV